MNDQVRYDRVRNYSKPIKQVSIKIQNKNRPRRGIEPWFEPSVIWEKNILI